MSREEQFLGEIELLKAKLDESFKVSEQIEEVKGCEARALETIRELKNSLKIQKQETFALENLVKERDSSLEKGQKDTVQLKRRVTWVTQLK